MKIRQFNRWSRRMPPQVLKASTVHRIAKIVQTPKTTDSPPLKVPHSSPDFSKINHLKWSLLLQLPTVEVKWPPPKWGTRITITTKLIGTETKGPKAWTLLLVTVVDRAMGAQPSRIRCNSLLKTVEPTTTCTQAWSTLPKCHLKVALHHSSAMDPAWTHNRCPKATIQPPTLKINSNWIKVHRPTGPIKWTKEGRGHL